MDFLDRENYYRCLHVPFILKMETTNWSKLIDWNNALENVVKTWNNKKEDIKLKRIFLNHILSQQQEN